MKQELQQDTLIHIMGMLYGDVITYTDVTYIEYPNLYAQENGGGIDTAEVNTNGIGRSDNGYTSPTTETSSKASSYLIITLTRYYFSNTPANYFKDYNGSSSTVRDILFNTGTFYYLASRSVINYSPYALFVLCCVSHEQLGSHPMFHSDGTLRTAEYHFRPVVSLGSNINIETCKGENSSTNMHQISK